MLVIRDAQLNVFKQVAVARFEDVMLDRIKASFPANYERLGDVGARELIRRAIAIGAQHQMTACGAVGVLIELMLQYGENLENSPDPSWAWVILNHRELPAHLKVDTIRDRFDPLLQGRRVVVTY